MAAAFGMTVHLSIMPRHLQLTVRTDTDKEPAVFLRALSDRGINFDTNAALSRLSWEIADSKITFEQALQQYRKIMETPRTPGWQVLLLTSLANASFCRLFGGDFAAMAVVFVCTLIGFRLKQFMLAHRVDSRVTFFCCAFVSSALCALTYHWHMDGTPAVAMGTAVLYLIPGVPYINSVSDLIQRYYLCAFYRFADAFVLTACLSAGLTAGMALLGNHWL